MKIYFPLKLSDIVLILLINVKMSATVGILNIMSRINFMLMWGEYEKSVLTLWARIVVLVILALNLKLYIRAGH